MDETGYISLLEQAQIGRITNLGYYWATLLRGKFSETTCLRLFITIFILTIAFFLFNIIILGLSGAVQPECYTEKLHVDKASNETQVINGIFIFLISFSRIGIH